MRTLLLLLLAAAPGVLAQDADVEPSPAIPAVTAKDIHVRAAPRGRIAGVLQAHSPLIVIGMTGNAHPHPGWVRIRTAQGKGWVDRAGLVDAARFAPRAAAFAPEATKEACAASLDACPLNGCAQPGSPHALLNTQKQGPGAGSVQPMPLASFRMLQAAAEELVGEAAELDAADRARIANLHLGNVTTGEGHLVAITGFIVGRPHANTGESVNCNFTDAPRNDFHISIAQGANHTEFSSVVVEMIPQQRNPAWTLAALAAVAQAKRRVVVVGQLFYDNVHHVNDNPNHPLPGQPKRFALWEVHPIRAFYVCTAPGCDAKTLVGFTKLEDLP